MSGRRVVVTGLGAVTPLGTNVAATWDGFTAGRSGIGPITMWDASDLEVRLGGEGKDFSALGVARPKEVRQMDRGCQYALVGAKESGAGAGLEIKDANRGRGGVVGGIGRAS